MSAPQTYRIYLPSAQKTMDFGGSGSAAINTFTALMRCGYKPEMASPGVELKVSYPLTYGGGSGECNPARAGQVDGLRSL